MTSKRALPPPSTGRITDTLNWLVQYERNEHDRTPDRGIPGVDGRPADVPIESVYSDTAATSSTTWPIHPFPLHLGPQRSVAAAPAARLHHPRQPVRQHLCHQRQGDKVTRAPLAAGSQGQQPHQQHRGGRPAADRPHRPSSAGGPGAGWQERTPSSTRTPARSPGRSLRSASPAHLQRRHEALQRRPSQVRGYGLYVQDQLSLGDWHLLAACAGMTSTVTSRRNDLGTREGDPLGHQPGAPAWAWCGAPSRSTPSTLLQQDLYPGGRGADRHHPGDKNNHLDPPHPALWGA